jgi:hypothetical protein
VNTPFKCRSAIFFIPLSALAFAGAAAAQAPHGRQARPAGSTSRPAQAFPAPVNLKVLSKGLGGSQVHDIMKQWSGELGVRCSACHVRDLEGIAPGGPPQRRFADDSKPMKQIARIMASMTEEINRKFITGDDGVPGPVTCGTCHRGDIRPDPFLVPLDAQQPGIQPVRRRIPRPART